MNNGGLLFGRVAQVTVVGKTGSAVTIGNNYDIKYSIDFNGGKATAEIIITNPPVNATAQVEGAKSVSVVGGYERYKGVIFVGEVTETESCRATINKIITIKAKVAAGSTSQKISLSGAPGITASALIATISAKTRHQVEIDSRVIDESYSAGFSFVGKASKAISQIATRIKARIINQATGNTVLIPADDTTPPTDIVIVTPETGMIGYPKKIKKDGNGWTITMLLNHKVKVGATVRIESEMTNLENNMYIVKRVKHDGSNKSGTSTTTIEAYNKGERK